MTDTWENEGGRIQELEATVEGLGVQNTDLERLVAQHQHRYDGAIRLVEQKDRLYLGMKQQALRMQQALQEVSAAYLKLLKGVEALTDAIGDLHEVHNLELDDAIDAVQAQGYKLLEQ